MNGKYILLGSNLGDRQKNLTKAIEILQSSGVSILRRSSIYESEPWGITDQPWFYNQVIEIHTALSAEDLLEICLKTEKDMGRIREIKWGARLIDIDLLYFNSEIINTENLQLPHPGIPKRRFTVMPLCELASNELDPATGQSIQQLLHHCTDPLMCQKIT